MDPARGTQSDGRAAAKETRDGGGMKWPGKSRRGSDDRDRDMRDDRDRDMRDDRRRDRRDNRDRRGSGGVRRVRED